MIAIIYRRVSTEDQGKEGYSLCEQLTACQRLVPEDATEVIDIHEDLGGDFIERPGIQRILSLAKTGQVGWLICKDPDRLSRNLTNKLIITNSVESDGVQLSFVDHDYHNTDEGKLFYAMRGAFAEYEKAKILTRTSGGKRTKAATGKLPGYVKVYGYVMDTDTDQLVVDPIEADWVRRIFEWASDPNPDTRLSVFAIAKRLNESGVPAPRGGDHWYRSTVAVILKNRTYQGTLEWFRTDNRGIRQAQRVKLPKDKMPKRKLRPTEAVVPIPVPQLIDEATWNRAQLALETDKARRSRGKMYMTTGIVFCGLCGGHMQSKGAPERRFLCCANRYPHSDAPIARRTMNCSMSYISAARVEEHVWQEVTRWMQSPEAYRQLLRGEAPAKEKPGLFTEIEVLQSQIEETNKGMDRLLALIARGTVASEVVEPKLAQLNKERGQQVKRLEQLQVQQKAIVVSEAAVRRQVSSLEALQAEVGRRLESLSDELRSNVIRRLVGRVVLHGRDPKDWAVEPLRPV